MSKQMLEIKYQCTHKSCYVNCREGVLGIEEETFNQLKAESPEERIFRSPKGICRMGFKQLFKVISMKRDDPNEVPQFDPSEDPFHILMEEHKEVIRKLDIVEGHLAKRDVEALWASTNDLENEIMLHSGIKEEEVLFPAMQDVIPFGTTLTDIIKEDHREVVSIMHSFRCALEDGDINDSVLISMIVSLKSHIRKEDNEFFEMVAKYVDADTRKRVVEGMRRAEREFVPKSPGDRRAISASKKSEKAKRDHYKEAESAVRENTCDTCCGH